MIISEGEGRTYLICLILSPILLNPELNYLAQLEG